MAKNGVRATDIKKALSQYHSDSYKSTIFFEVKTGPTYFNSDLLIMDGLAIKKSWKNPKLTGYEIKVSRSDFLRDEKWRGYLDYCHKFYFVCPKGLISRDEIEALDENVGLMYYHKDYNNCRLHTMKAPVYRNIGFPPKELLYYILLSKVDRDKDPFYDSQADYFRELVERKENNKSLGFAVRGKIGDVIVEQEKENNELQRKLERYEGKEEILSNVVSYLSKKGILSRWDNNLRDDWEDKLDEVLGSNLASHEKRKIKDAINSVERLKNIISQEAK